MRLVVGGIEVDFSMHYFVADTHFGHHDIISRFNRPFESTIHMDNVILTNLHKKVGPDDDLWILGDFAWNRGAPEGWLEALYENLPGARCHLITGNRDTKETRSLPWDTVNEIAEITAKDGWDQEQKLVLSHYPLMTWNGASKGALHMFGHVHSNWVGSKRAVNIGVELWEYSAVSVDEVQARARTLPEHPMWDVLETAPLEQSQSPEDQQLSA